MEYPFVIVVGESGRGKSRAIKNLDPEKTVIINIESKVLPFKGAAKFKKSVNSDFFATPEYLLSFLKELSTRDDIKVVVIDSFSKWSEQLYKFAQRAFKSSHNKFDIPNFYNDTLYDLFEVVKALNKYVILIGHPEISETMTGETIKSLSVLGKKWRGKVEKESMIVLYANARKNDDGGIEYFFETQTDGVTSAKSPEGMFDSLEIDNDYNFVIDKIKEYYNE